MNFLLVGITQCLFAFAAGWAVGLLFAHVATHFRGGQSTRMTLIMGVAPLGCGTLAAVLFVGPAFLLYEPRDTHEVPGIVFLVTAGTGLVLLGRTVMRFGRMMTASHRVQREWARHAEPLPSTTLPTMVIDAGCPLVAVVGLAHSSLYIDRRVMTSCSSDEIEAITAHELGHVKSRDNAKRVALAATRGFGHPLVAAWREAAELDADRFAATDEPRRLALASALLKVARLATAPRVEALGVSRVYEGGSVDTRVRALLSHAGPVLERRRARTMPIAVAMVLLISLSWMPIHEALEVIINL